MKHTILAVDDEPANVRMLERLFHKDFRVLTATSGEDALEILKRETVTLIITDQRMPGMSGTDLLRESLQSRPEAIKIILTGYTDIEALIEAINVSRVYRFVSKPWDPISLKNLVQEALAEHDRQTEQRKLLEGLVTLIQSHPGIFIEPAVSSDELLANPMVEN